MKAIYETQPYLRPEEITSASDLTIEARFSRFNTVSDREAFGDVTAHAVGVPLKLDSYSPDFVKTILSGSAYYSAFGGLRAVTIDFAGIDEDYQRRGIGSRLCKAFASIAIAEGRATHLVVETSQASLAVRDRVFGAEQTSFYHQRTVRDHSGNIVMQAGTPVDSSEAREMVSKPESYRTSKIAYDQYMDELTEKHGYYPTRCHSLTQQEKDEWVELEHKLARHFFTSITDMREADTSGWQADIEIVKPAER